MQTAKDVMATDVVTTPATTSVHEAMDLMRAKQLRALMVEPDYTGDAYGIVTEADIVYKVAAGGRNPSDVVVGEIMTKPCVEVDPDLAVEDVARLFAHHHIHRAPVVKGELLGVISIFDIVRESMWWQE